MGINELTGTPWHIEVLQKDEDDPRRHYKWCKYYTPEMCTFRRKKCRGSAHCEHYKEKIKTHEKQNHNSNNPYEFYKKIQQSKSSRTFTGNLSKKKDHSSSNNKNTSKTSSYIEKANPKDFYFLSDSHPPKKKKSKPPKRAKQLTKEERESWVKEYNQLSDYQKKQLAKKNHKKKK